MKPKLTYAEFVAAMGKRVLPWKEGTVAHVIQRMIDDIAAQPQIKQIQQSHMFGLTAIQKMPFAARDAATLKRQDWIDLVKWRRLKVGAATAGQTVSMLMGVFKYACGGFDDCEKLQAPLLALQVAKPYMVKMGLIAKATPRTRRPTDEEHQQLIAYFAKQNEHALCTTDMVKIAEWQRRSARRISESCRITWSGWNKQEQTLLVTKMKDPRKRKDKVVALTEEAQAMLLEMEPHRLTDDPNERIFPFNSKTCSARYTAAKKALGITGLRMHDSRRDCGTRLVEEKGYSSNEAILFTGHDSTREFERTYLTMRPELMRHGPMTKRKNASPS